MRWLIVFLIVCCVTTADAQRRRNNRPARPQNDPFLNSQWWLGFRVGSNITKGVPSQSYTSFSPVNYNPDRIGKQYDGFGRPGIQAALEFAYYTRKVNISLQPGFATMYYGYKTDYQWEDPANSTTTLSQTFTIEDNLQVFDLPLMIKYEFLSGNVHPFIQLGGYYNLTINASKKIDVQGVDQASGSDVPFSGEPVAIGTKDHYNKSTAGVMGGLGVVYDAGNVRFLFDASYKYGLTNITNSNARYSNTQLASIGDVPDDLTLEGIWLNLSIQFPLKFISKNYEAVN